MDKREWRRELRARVERLTRRQKREHAAALCRDLLSDPRLKEARSVAVYLALPDEPDPDAALVGLLAAGKRLALPVPDPEGDWVFREIRDLDTHRRGPWGLSLPEPGDVVPGEELDVVLVPGRGFTPDGRRLGRGKGIYDRLLADIPALKLGLAFPCQVVDDLPADPHDVRMDEVWSGQS